MVIEVPEFVDVGVLFEQVADVAHEWECTVDDYGVPWDVNVYSNVIEIEDDESALRRLATGVGRRGGGYRGPGR